MAKREAVSTIRGYFYQFDYTILKVLELEHDDDTICIEGIEDVDISNEDNITFHQCKCYEETEYNHSVIAPAVRWMLKHFSENKTMKRGSATAISIIISGNTKKLSVLRIRLCALFSVSMSSLIFENTGNVTCEVIDESVVTGISWSFFACV